MYHTVLAANHLTLSTRKLSEDAVYEEFGAAPFAPMRKTIRATDRLLQRLRALRARPFPRRRKASVV